jgi:hypothetical protein
VLLLFTALVYCSLPHSIVIEFVVFCNSHENISFIQDEYALCAGTEIIQNDPEKECLKAIRAQETFVLAIPSVNSCTLL